VHVAAEASSSAHDAWAVHPLRFVVLAGTPALQVPTAGAAAAPDGVADDRIAVASLHFVGDNDSVVPRDAALRVAALFSAAEARGSLRVSVVVLGSPVLRVARRVNPSQRPSGLGGLFAFVSLLLGALCGTCRKRRPQRV
jgi:hypothetical protein